ncbi:MAG: hypothetical protein ACKO96_44890, partial [Flammeovirgaceae bacterium]
MARINNLSAPASGQGETLGAERFSGQKSNKKYLEFQKSKLNQSYMGITNLENLRIHFSKHTFFHLGAGSRPQRVFIHRQIEFELGTTLR